ncbi:MAG: hypothetical protein GYB67_02940 [Chloroflexi bacterium]|nr:hypothetical protein [Chloroflexota bacterium]
MPLPALNHWEQTAPHLHRAARLLGPVRASVTDHQPNFLELPMFILPEGLTTGRLPQGGEVICNFKTGQIIYQPASGEAISFAWTGHSQKSLFEALLMTLKSHELAGVLADVPDDQLISGIIEKCTKDGKQIFATFEELSDPTPFAYDAQVASDYAAVQYAIFTAVARFRGWLTGPMTPIVVWPEHFDLSTLWFGTDKAAEHDPHMNFGFAPFSGSHPRPYLYVYAYPYPTEYETPTLPDGARWETQDYTGVHIAYDDIAKQADSEAYVEAACHAIFRSLRALLP